MATLSRVLTRRGFGYRASRAVVCADLFEELMNVEELPRRIRVTASTEPIEDAARVSVVWRSPAMGFEWVNWDGNERALYSGADRYLELLGVSKTKPQDIWIDWEPA